jgi:DNA adenine methylase
LISTRKEIYQSIQLPNGGGIRPPLKWAGGKRWLIPQLRQLWLPHKDRRFVEPFCGGLAACLGLLPARALLSDINPHTINFYSWLKKGLQSRLPMHNDEKIYYQLREKFNALIASGKQSSKEAAELFYYLNRTDYNGLCRFNRKGEFNVPFGQYAKIGYITDFTPYQPIFKAWHFQVLDFESLEVAPGDFIYADPPYDVEFRQYSKEGFNWQDQVRLAEWLAAHQGPVVLSNQATKRVVKLYKELGFKIYLFEAPRMINCTGDRTKAKEIVATKGGNWLQELV